jgi:integrase
VFASHYDFGPNILAQAVNSLSKTWLEIPTSNLVFPSNRKVGVRLLDLKKGFKKAVRLAKMPKIRFHDLRHTFTKRLVQAGVDIITVQHLLGHAKISMTARYAHPPDYAKVAAVNRLGNIRLPTGP